MEMRKIYILVAVIFVSSILLFIATFIYLDKTKHRIHYFTISLNDRDAGTVKIDRFETEDKIIYRSDSARPFDQIFTETKTRLTLNRRYELEDYSNEREGSGAAEFTHIQKKEHLASFLSVFKSRFAALNNIPVKDDTFIFKEESPVTYLPLVENYNFKNGGSQGFRALINFSEYLPPQKRFVTLTSIRDEYLKIDSRRIKAENLILKIRNYPQGSVWVSKADRSLLKLEIPKNGIRITRSFSPKKLEAKKYVPAGGGYSSREVTFKTRGLELTGTLTIPEKEGKAPGVLLVWGDGPQDREYQGMFTSLADYLSRNGFSVLRFDMAGIAKSAGDSSATTSSDEAEDVGAACQYLADQKEVDGQKIFIISHSSGVYHAARAALEKSMVRALILMSPSLYSWQDDEQLELARKLAERDKWSDEYLNLVARSIRETSQKAKNAAYDWIYVLGKRCFVKNMKEELGPPIELIGRIKIPVLILQGKEDEELFTDYAAMIDKALAENGNSKRILTYYGYLGHFLGNRLWDGVHNIHYEIDKELAENIISWLNRILAEPIAQPDSAPAIPETKIVGQV